MKKIKLIILDVDGVLTDGAKLYDISGLAKYKKFCDKDFTAIKRAKSSGAHVCFLSGDQSINEQVAKNRNIDFYYARGKSKASFVDLFSKKYNCTAEEMLFIGDDLFDVDLLKIVGFAVATADSCAEAKDASHLTLKSNGGENALMELVDHLYDNQMLEPFCYQRLLDLDSKESF